MKIYTRTGDKGFTSLATGKRIQKTNPLIEAIGDIDELNSLLGLLNAKVTQKTISDKLLRVQKHLFQIGSILAMTGMQNQIKKKLEITKSDIEKMEREIDLWTASLPILKNFILPGGSIISSEAFLARAVCRRAERSLLNVPKIDPHVYIYMNRLSDWLFTIAREINRTLQTEEIIWKSTE